MALAMTAAIAGSGRAGAASTTDRRGELIRESAAMTWSTDELRKIIEADDLKVSPSSEDGMTYGTPTWIWCVAVDCALYVRAYNGRSSRWYQAAIRQKGGRIIAAGRTTEVRFEPVEGPINDRIDDACRAKYRGSRYLEPMIGSRARGATVKVVPTTSPPDLPPVPSAVVAQDIDQ